MLTRFLSGDEETAELMVRLALQTGDSLLDIYEQIRTTIADVVRGSGARPLLENELDESLVRLVARLRSPVTKRPAWHACVLSTEGRGVPACISHLLAEAGSESIVLSAQSGQHTAMSTAQTVALMLPTIDCVVIDGSRTHPDAISRCLRLMNRHDFAGSGTKVVLLTDPGRPIDPTYRCAIPSLIVVGHLTALLTALGITMANPLTAREREVLREVASGATNEQVARRLGVAVSTTKTYLERIHVKLKSRDRASAVAVAMLHDWL